MKWYSFEKCSVFFLKKNLFAKHIIIVWRELYQGCKDFMETNQCPVLFICFLLFHSGFDTVPTVSP